MFHYTCLAVYGKNNIINTLKEYSISINEIICSTEFIRKYVKMGCEWWPPLANVVVLLHITQRNIKLLQISLQYIYYC